MVISLPVILSIHPISNIRIRLIETQIRGCLGCRGGVNVKHGGMEFCARLYFGGSLRALEKAKQHPRRNQQEKQRKNTAQVNRLGMVCQPHTERRHDDRRDDQSHECW